MTPVPSAVERNGFTLSPLLLGAVVLAATTTALLGLTFGVDLYNNDRTPDRATLACLIVVATMWTGVFCASLRDAWDRRSSLSDSRIDTLAEQVKDIAVILTDFRRQSDRAMVVIHDEVNGFAEAHTGEIQRLTEAIATWGDEQETRGELVGLRRAVGIASVDRPDAKVPGRHLKSTS